MLHAFRVTRVPTGGKWTNLGAPAGHLQKNCWCVRYRHVIRPALSDALSQVVDPATRPSNIGTMVGVATPQRSPALAAVMPRSS